MSTGGQRTILDRLETAAASGPKLYHATRLVLADNPDSGPAKPTAENWSSEVSLADGWQEFLSEVTVFETREYWRLERWQQSCYYGAIDRINEYTVLACEAWHLLPIAILTPLTDARILHMDRDVWTFALYFLAMGNSSAYGFDVFGSAPYASVPQYAEQLKMLFARTVGGPEQDEPALARFREWYFEAIGAFPQFIYAALRLDVFSASALAIRYLIENPGTWYEASNALAALSLAVSVDSSIAGHGEGNKTGSSTLRNRASGPVRLRNEERDRWIYDQCMKGIAYAKIKGDLAEQAKSTGWSEVRDEQAIHQAMKRFAERFQLPLPPRRRKDG